METAANGHRELFCALRMRLALAGELVEDDPIGRGGDEAPVRTALFT
ncbi:MAG: hypothetical protein JOZ05_25005 [Acetobacteraceae bacterium]|nr:hypothetical protein [Acetobacteraceae bacterium]